MRKKGQKEVKEERKEGWGGGVNASQGREERQNGRLDECQRRQAGRQEGWMDGKEEKG
jgi:hypothetical protein